MITTVLNNTNKKIMALIEQLPEEVRSNDKYTHLREVTKEELLAFFGISYARGLLGQNFLKLRRLFSVDVGHPIFSASMSFNRLVFIKAMISFDDANTRQERWRTDRFAAFREIFEEFNKCCAKTKSPDDYIAMDETYPTRGGISFKTYNKDKPDKYDLNFRSLGSSRRPYLYYTVPYTGKPVEVTESHIKDTLTLVKRIAGGYEQHGYSLKGTNISMDPYYTSFPQAKWLYDKNVTCIGTLNSNRKGLPKEIKETKGREENSWISCKSDKGEVTLNLYVMKANSSGMRNVLLLQTTNPAHYVTQDDKKAS